MADQENLEQKKGTEPARAGGGTPSERGQDARTTSARIMPWVVTAFIVVVFAAGGFIVGRLFGTRGAAQTASAADQDAPAQSTDGRQTSDRSDGSWYYDLEPVVVNLNEPGVTRYARVGLTLEVGNTLKQEEGTALLDRKKPLLKHWLTLYVANQTIEDTRGEKNLVRMQGQISDAFNEGLFPDTKPHIRRVLFKELSIQ